MVQGAVDTITNTLKFLEREFVQPPLRRAGHMLCFHPGEQPHAGVGTGGHRCALTGLSNRAVLYAVGVPRRSLALFQNLSLAGAEGNTWGLMRAVTVSQVGFSGWGEEKK